jgi:predicted neutral ceramidase superfamily lipid hydrolase
LGKALQNNGVGPGQINQILQNVPTYWGKQPATAPYYLGAIMIFLFVFGLLQKNPYLKIWITSSIILGILLSWGSNFSGFNYFMFDNFPGYNKFRSVSFALVIPIFLAPVLSSIGLNNFLKNPDQELLKKLFYALAITGGFALLVIIFAGAASFRGAVDAQLAEQMRKGELPSWFLQVLREDRESLMRGDAIRSLILILLSGGLIWLIFMKKVSQNAGIAGIILLALIDSFSVSKRYLNEDNFKERANEQQFIQTEADQRILQGL